MTKTIFILPVANRSALSCVWIRTGNPEQPLACMWVDGDLQTVVDHEESKTEPYRLCA
jgi:hypothetical protein